MTSMVMGNKPLVKRKGDGDIANQSLQGKVVVVGAGAQNLGGLISRTFGADGASVVVYYNSDATKTPADATVKTSRLRAAMHSPSMGI